MQQKMLSQQFETAQIYSLYYRGLEFLSFLSVECSVLLLSFQIAVSTQQQSEQPPSLYWQAQFRIWYQQYPLVVRSSSGRLHSSKVGDKVLLGCEKQKKNQGQRRKLQLNRELAHWPTRTFLIWSQKVWLQLELYLV